MPITPTVEYFANPAVVLRRIEVLTRPSPIPSTRGIYAWYFNGLKEFELCDCPRLESGAALLGTSKNRRFQPATVSSGLKSSGLPVL